VDQQQFEQQKQQLQSDIQMLNEKLIVQRENGSALQQQYHSLQQSYSTLKNNNESQYSQIQQLPFQLENTEKAKNKIQYASQHWQAQCTDMQKSLNDKVDLVTSHQIEIKILSQKLISADQAIATLESQSKLLAHDKWILGQEKAQLEGQLKQMQRMISA
jgi:predicted  nucleic acid-binding Zn-ribbon protein